MAQWSSDVPVSMPLPAKNPGIVPMGGGFMFNRQGFFPDIDDVMYREIATPTFAPATPPSDIIWDDEDPVEDPGQREYL